MGMADVVLGANGYDVGGRGTAESCIRPTISGVIREIESNRLTLRLNRSKTKKGNRCC